MARWPVVSGYGIWACRTEFGRVGYSVCPIGQSAPLREETTKSKEALNEDVSLSAEASKKYDELVALLAAEQYGEDGPSLEITFAEIEEYGHRVGRMVARGVDAHLASQQSGRLETEQVCPTCQACWEETSKRKLRPLRTVDGDVPLAEPRFHCPVCNRDFFPSDPRDRR